MINDSISRIDSILFDELENGSQDISKITKVPKVRNEFPIGTHTKRDKLKHILRESGVPMTAREIKENLLLYNEVLPNVDQSLVNLEKDRLIISSNENGRKKYSIK